MPDPQYSGADRRTVSRHPFTGKVSLKDRPGEPMEPFGLSSRGVGLRTRLRIGRGRPLDLVLRGHSMSVEGVVRHETTTGGSDFRVGIEFLEPQPELAEVALLLSGTYA